MKISIASDLHLEFGKIDHSIFDNKEDAKVLVLAGDVDTYRNFKARNEDTIEFFKMCKRNFSHVIYIMGNHEHYHGTYNKTYNLIKEVVEPLGIIFLEKGHFITEGTLFVACTLWTNFNNRDWFSMFKAKKNMNDYKAIKFRRQNGTYRKLRPEDLIRDNEEAFGFIKQQLQGSKRLKTVVVTHHAPSELSVSDRFKASKYHDLNGAYRNNYEEYILDNGPDVWIHGHTHDEVDEVLGKTKIICNPRGYWGEETRAHNFNKLKTIEI